MKLHRDVLVLGPPDALIALRKRLGKAASGPWKRSTEDEARAAKDDLGTPPPFVFRYVGGRFPVADLWLFWKGDRAEVTNIVPRESSELDHDDYNAMAADFAEAVLSHAAEGLDLEVRLGDVARTFEQECSDRVYTALKAFSVGANKSTLHAHPMDAQRWRTFVILAHVDGAPTDSELLADWLANAGEWPANDAQELSFEYFRGRELLRGYDEYRGNPPR